MEGNNQNNIDGYMPQEIPIPGVSDTDNAYGQQPQSNDAYNPYVQPAQNNAHTSYGQQIQNGSYNPYGQQPQNNQYGYDPYQAQGRWNGQPIPPYQPKEQKKGTAKIIIAVVCICVALIAIIVGAMFYFRSTPTYKISKGFQNIGREITQMRNPMMDKIGSDELLLMMEKDGCHVDTRLDFSMDLPMVGTTTLGIDTDFYKDMHAKELNADTTISLYNYDFAHLNIYADDEVFCFSILELFVEDMYIENENVVSQFNDSILAEAFSQSDAEDFSIDFFSEDKVSIKDWKSFTEAFKAFKSDLDACKDGMTIEKVEKGLYRVTFPQKETNRLVMNFINEYAEVYEMTDSMDIFEEYDEWISSDVSILFEIDSKNRIDSILLEDPVEMLDGEAAVSGELFFMGEDKSIEKIQGKLSVEGVDGETREIIGQLVQSATEEDYQATMDFKYSDGYSDGKMKYVMNCDAVRDEFDMTISVMDDVDDFDVKLEGSLEDIVKGESIQFCLDKLIFDMDDEELFRLSGEIALEPITDKIEPSVEPKTAFFEMSMYDWEKIIDRIDDEYGSLLDALW
ncbi:MAG: resistance to Congo red protein [Eubacterium sp.]|nr:resistance to Congo red protein [Eubacterium sp.]